jgi:hypothetical protein
MAESSTNNNDNLLANTNKVNNNKPNKEPKKSSLLKKLILIILIGLIAGSGYYFYNKSKQNNGIEDVENLANSINQSKTIIKFLPKSLLNKNQEEENQNINNKHNLEIQYILMVKLLLDNIRENKNYEPVLDLLVILNNNKKITLILERLKPYAQNPTSSNSQLTFDFDDTIYEIAYLDYLSKDNSVFGMLNHTFHKLIFIKNRTITNPTDIRYKLNSISNNLAKNNIEEALNSSKILESINNYKVKNWLNELKQQVEISKIKLEIENELKKYMN